jgi:hypothetical protein
MRTKSVQQSEAFVTVEADKTGTRNLGTRRPLSEVTHGSPLPHRTRSVPSSKDEWLRRCDLGRHPRFRYVLARRRQGQNLSPRRRGTLYGQLPLYGRGLYRFHSLKTWATTTTIDDTKATNLPYRNIGIPYPRAARGPSQRAFCASTFPIRTSRKYAV